MTALSTWGCSLTSFQPPALIQLYQQVQVVLIIDLKVQGRKKKYQTYVWVALILDLKVEGRKKKTNLCILNQ